MCHSVKSQNYCNKNNLSLVSYSALSESLNGTEVEKHQHLLGGRTERVTVAPE